jgi:hypothetical protein
MATLASYADLQDAIAAWLGQTNLASARSDIAANIPIFISLFEAAANRRLRVRQQEATTSLTTSGGSVALPSDYLNWRRLTWTGATRHELQYVEPSILQSMFPTQPSDTPEYFTIEGANILVRPINDPTALEFVYFQKIPALSSGVNWLFAAHPGIYLFGALCEAAAYNVNDERVPLWLQRRDEIFDEIEQLSDLSRGAGAIMTMGPTP